MKELVLPCPDDFHVHLRQGTNLPLYTKDLAFQFGRALIMPNTVPPIDSAIAVQKYKAEILNAASEVSKNFTPLMTFKLKPTYTKEDLIQMQLAGAIAAKYYPAGVTTNSADGISDFEAVFPVLKMMEDSGIILCVHGEEPGAFCLDREFLFIERMKRLVQEFPKLKIVFEHLSTAASVEFVKNAPENIAATITVHHLLMTLDDIIGNALCPHHFCKPLPKLPKDKEALREVVFSGNKKFFFGSDSAPHLKENKECECGAAGVYSMLSALPLLATEFENAGALDKLENFICHFGRAFYGLKENPGTITLVKESWNVPDNVHGVVPLAAGKTLQWKVKV